MDGAGRASVRARRRDAGHPAQTRPNVLEPTQHGINLMPAAVIAGARAGAGRATLGEFARHGYSVGLPSRCLRQAHGTVPSRRRAKPPNGCIPERLR